MDGLQSTESPSIAHGFSNPVFDSQAVFRILLDAIAHPARMRPLLSSLAPPSPLYSTTAAALLTLADFETAVWLDPVYAQAADFLRFHTGARIVDAPSDATFAVVPSDASLPEFSAFAQGTPEYPDRSTTLLIEARTMSASGGIYRGPGIAGERTFGFDPCPADFAGRLANNRELFPCGVDLLVFDARHVAALPRSIRIGAR